MMLYLGLGMIVLGAAAVAVGFYFRRKAAQLLAAPFRKTGEVPGLTGVVSCEGAVRIAQPLIAPCSGQPCAYYQLEVQQQVKESQGGQTKIGWKKVADHHAGALFFLDDGSGPVAVHAQDRLDADLRTSFSGPPPGGPGLGVLAGSITPPPTRGEVLGYKVTERIIGLDGPLFAMGQAQGGHLTPPASGRLVVSTRGREGLVGARRRVGAIALAVGALVAAGGVPILILRPGEAKPCGAMTDTVGECAIASKERTMDEPQPDGSTRQVTVQEHVHEWTVTRPGSYELFARQPSRKGKTFPRIQVEDAATGFPVNIGINWGIGGDSAHATSTKTMALAPGKYRIYVWSDKGGPSTLLFKIAPVAEQAASR